MLNEKYNAQNDALVAAWFPVAGRQDARYIINQFIQTTAWQHKLRLEQK